MKTFLKLKLEYFVGEARINKKYVQKAVEKARITRDKFKQKGEKYREGFLRESMYRHRLDVIRPELRNSHLAYNFLRGNKYSNVEKRVRQWPNFDKVFAIVQDFNTTQDGNRRNYYWRDVDQMKEAFDKWRLDPDVEYIGNRSKKRSNRKPHKSKSQWEFECKNTE